MNNDPTCHGGYEYGAINPETYSAMQTLAESLLADVPTVTYPKLEDTKAGVVDDTSPNGQERSASFKSGNTAMQLTDYHDYSFSNDGDYTITITTVDGLENTSVGSLHHKRTYKFQPDIFRGYATDDITHAASGEDITHGEAMQLFEDHQNIFARRGSFEMRAGDADDILRILGNAVPDTPTL